jgi:hypothetical protein
MFNAAGLIQSLLREPPKHLSFEKTRELLSLLTWMVLERRPRQNPRYDPDKRRNRSAEDASFFALGWLLERERRRKKKTVRRSEMETLFNDSGGFIRVWRAQNSYHLFKQARDTHVELLFVYQLVRHLCRFEQHDPNNVKFQLGAAKAFCSEWSKETATPYSVSEIDKIGPHIRSRHRSFLRFTHILENPSSPATDRASAGSCTLLRLWLARNSG